MEPKIIHLDSEALEALIDKVVGYIKHVHQIKDIDWISTEEAMKLLQITSPTTLSRLRKEGKVKYSQPMHKVVLYSRESIVSYLNKNSRDVF